MTNPTLIPYPISQQQPYNPQGEITMFRLLASGITLFGLMALAAALTTTNGRAEPALTHAASVLPPPP